MLAARNSEELETTLSELPAGAHGAVELDVGDENSWIAAREVIGSIDCLVHAAGVQGPIGAIEEVGAADIETTIRTNLLGTILAIRESITSVRDARGAMVVFSGGGATSPLPKYDTYATTKAGVVRLVENVATQGVRINAVAPGFVATGIHQATLDAGPDKAGTDYYEATVRQLEDGGVTAATAADLVAYLLSAEAEGVSGRLISAPWDPWAQPGFASSVVGDPDFGRLRRIDRQAYFGSE